MRWVFAQRLAGHSLARITRALNETGIPCPSAADPDRNAHRTGERWSLTTVRAILANPRYTGWQVWNRQPTAMDLIDPANTGLGHRQVQRRGLPEGWVISARPAHPALVSEADFTAVQGIRAARQGTDSARRYRLAGLLRCGICGRRAESCWCTVGPPTAAAVGTPARSSLILGGRGNLYIREDRILPHVPALYLLLTGTGPAAGRRRRRTRHGADVNRPASDEDVISYLRPPGHPHLPSGHQDPAGRQPRRRQGRHRPRKLTPTGPTPPSTRRSDGGKEEVSGLIAGASPAVMSWDLPAHAVTHGN